MFALSTRLFTNYIAAIGIDPLRAMDTLKTVFVEGLRPSQTYGVMSSAVSLPNRTSTGQA